MSGAWLVSYVVLWFGLLGLAVLVLVLYRELGEIYLGTSAGVSRDGPPIGTAAASFTLPDYRHDRFTFPRPNTAALVVFGSQQCGPCQRLFPELATWGSRYRHQLDTVVIDISEGGLDNEIVDQLSPDVVTLWGYQARVLKDYKVRVSPFAVLIDNQGKVVAKGLVNNSQHLEDLLENGFAKNRFLDHVAVDSQPQVDVPVGHPG